MTLEVVKEGVKRHEEVSTRRVNAKDATIVAVRRTSELQWEAGRRATVAKQAADAHHIQEQLRLFQQAAQNSSLAGIPMPSLDPFLQALHSQTPPHQAAQQNGASQDPADTAIHAPPATHSHDLSALEGDL